MKLKNKFQVGDRVALVSNTRTDIIITTVIGVHYNKIGKQYVADSYKVAAFTDDVFPESALKHLSELV